MGSIKALVLNKQILLSLSAIVFAAAVVATATGAFFTDTEAANPANVITAGTLALEVNDNNSTGTFTLDLGDTDAMAPGDLMAVEEIKIENNGSMNLGWVGYFTTSGANASAMSKKVYIKEMQMEFKDADSNDWETADDFITNGIGDGTYGAYYTNLKSTDPNALDGGISLEHWNSVANNMMGVGGGVFMGALKEGDYDYRLTFQLGLDESAGNNLQGKTMNIGFVAMAMQVNEAAITETLNSGAPLIGAANAAAHKTWMEAQIANQTE